jgi:hypothetical protein
MRLHRTGKLTTVRFTGDFWTKVEMGAPETCWPWKGFRKSSGHGLTSMKGRPMHTSRKAWVLTHGAIKDGMQVLHKCDNAICCNPDHMYLGTRIDNILDQWEQPAAADRGPRDGRRFMLTDEQLKLLWLMRKEGATLRACASHFGVHFATVCRYVTAIRKEKLQQLRAKVAADQAGRI